MTIPVLIVDDSGLARKQLARSLPADWDVSLSFAGDGREALKYIRAERAEVVFLDLNMPILDGYQTLELMRDEGLKSRVIVVSGDIQPDALKRVKQLGAIDFIRKPADQATLLDALQRNGIFQGQPVVASSKGVPPAREDRSARASQNPIEAFREITNVAMGQAGDLLARLLNVFVQLPIPQVNLLEASELRMALQATRDEDKVTSVCQGFIGAGVAGEAMLIFHDSNYQDMSRLMGGELPRTPDISADTAEAEMVLDVATVLIGAVTKGIAEQLDIKFSLGHPLILGRHVDINDLLAEEAFNWRRILCAEFSYSIEHHDLSCDVLLLFTEDSLRVIRNKVAYLM